MKTLYIHIGTAKTGTSAIQRFLRKNADLLYQKGYIFRPMPFHDYHKTYLGVPETRNAYFLHGLPRRQPGYDEEKNRARLREGLSVLAAWFREKDRIILTDEATFRLLGKWDFAEQIAAWAKEQEVAVRWIVYFRRQDEYLESYYRQSAKDSMRERSDVQSYIERKLPTTDYGRNLDYLEAIYGQEQILVRVYDPAGWKAAGSSIFADFLGLLGLPLTEEYQFPKKELVNASLSLNAAWIKRIVNRADAVVAPERKAAVNQLFNMAGNALTRQSPDDRPYTVLRPEDREAIWDALRGSNDRIAQKYLGQEHLFPEGPSEKTLWQPDREKLTEDMVLYYGFVTAALYQDILKREEQIRQLQRTSPLYLLSRLLGGRKKS